MTRGSVRPPSDPFGWAGAVLDGRYRIGDVVGEGGFGVVHAGRCLGTDEPVAIKFLKLDDAVPFAGRGRFLSQFIGEGRLLSRLAELTPGVVRAIDVGAATAPCGVWTPYLVLEWLDGVTLEEELAARLEAGLGGRGLREAIELLEPAAQAIEVAHEHGALHRDIKPGNLVVTEVGARWTLKILDFGVAKVMRDLRARSETASASPARHAFSPPYGAPEQFEQRYGATGPWTDVFALALVLVEVVAGRRALTGDDTGELYRQATDPSRRPTLRTLGVGSGDEVESVLQRALAIEPRHRHRRAGAFWEALVAASTAEPAPPVEVRPPPAEAAESSDSGQELPPDEAGWEVTEVAPDVVSKIVPDVAPAVVPAAMLPAMPAALPAVAPEVVAGAPRARVVAPVSQGGGDARRAPLVLMAIALSGFAAALLARTPSRSAHQSEGPSGSARPSASRAPIDRRPPAIVEPVAPVAMHAENDKASDAVSPATIATVNEPAAAPIPATTPRVRAPAPPGDRLCPNCATHPNQCGKFSLPLGRGDCYCGCSVSSHCALGPGRTTGPCASNTDGVSESL